MIVKFDNVEYPKLIINVNFEQGLKTPKTYATHVLWVDAGYYVWSHIRTWYQGIPAPLVWHEGRRWMTLFGADAAFLFHEYFKNENLKTAVEKDLTNPKKFDTL